VVEALIQFTSCAEDQLYILPLQQLNNQLTARHFASLPPGDISDKIMVYFERSSTDFMAVEREEVAVAAAGAGKASSTQVSWSA
jgi:hypothetical protein